MLTELDLKGSETGDVDERKQNQRFKWLLLTIEDDLAPRTQRPVSKEIAPHKGSMRYNE